MKESHNEIQGGKEKEKERERKRKATVRSTN